MGPTNLFSAFFMFSMFPYKFLHLKISSFALNCTIGRQEGAVDGRRQAELGRKEGILIVVILCTEKEREICRLLNKVELNRT
jgi:hypothetical protein